MLTVLVLLAISCALLEKAGAIALQVKSTQKPLGTWKLRKKAELGSFSENV